jgi:hypothetical protein
MPTLPQSKWRYVAANAVMLGGVSGMAKWLLFDMSGEGTPGRLAGRIIISTVFFGIPLGLFFWRIGGPGSRPSSAAHAVNPDADLELQARAVPTWAMPLVVLMVPLYAMLVGGGAILAIIGIIVMVPAGILLSLQNGRIRVHPRGIELGSWSGRSSLDWTEVTAIETDPHRNALVLFSGERYLPLPSRMFWTGPARFEAEALIDHHLAARGVPVRLTSWAGFRFFPRGVEPPAAD